MATARLRRTFEYLKDGADHLDGTNDDDDDVPLDLYEEEQEQLIDTFEKQDQACNKTYKRIFLALPAIAILVLLQSLVQSGQTQIRMLSLLCITSLLLTSYDLLDPTKPWPPHSSASPDAHALAHSESGPLHRFLPPANGTLSLLLGIAAVLQRAKHDAEEAFWMPCLLPLACFLLVALAKRLFVSVDVHALRSLKYEYKGA